MAPNPNIEKRIYLNNRRWDAVDTNSITGDPLMSAGAEPSMIRFTVNRHFDSHESDYGANIAVPDLNYPICHLDNIKLFIAPMRDNIDWPEIYTGRNNFSDASSSDRVMSAMESCLAWQGVYVDPAAGFSLDDGNLQHDERFSVACYDYRWCMAKCRFRVYTARRTWSSSRQGELYGITPPGDVVDPYDGYRYTNGWLSDADDNISYEFIYNQFNPQCPNAKPRPWVMIAGHIIRQAMLEYFQNDPGTLQKTIPDDTGAEISFSGLLLGPTGAERLFDYSDIDYFFDEPDGTGSYYVDPEIPVAGSDKTERDFLFRGFVPEPLSISNASLTEALQFVLDSVGNFIMYMDQWNCLHFERVASSDELSLPDATSLNDAGDLYLCHFLDDDGTSIQTWHNFRGLDIRPRAVPKANRVVGQLRGKAPVAAAIVNTDATASGGATSYAHYCGELTPVQLDRDDFVPQKVVTQRHFANKLHAVWGSIRKPIRIVPYIHALNGVEVNVNSGASAVLSTGWMVGAGSGTPSPVEVTETVNDKVTTYRFAVDFAVSPAALSIKEMQQTESGDNSAPYSQLSGGHTVLLSEPAYTVVRVSGRSVEMIDGAPDVDYADKTKYFYITHSWSARGSQAEHSVSYAGNRNSAIQEDGDVCLYGMGIAPNARVWTIDSTIDGPEWDGLREYDDDDVLTFPGKGDYDRSIMTAPVIFANVRDFIPENTGDDNDTWDQLWSNAQTELAKVVKIAALQFRQLVTTGTLPIFYDKDLRLGHRVCIIGTRDDNLDVMRLKTLFARITAVRFTSADELELELTDEIMGQSYTLFGSLLSQLKF